MKILIDLINFPKGGSRGHDWRYGVWLPVGKYLQQHGHDIFTGTKVGVKHNPFNRHRGDVLDFYICHSPYNNQIRTHQRKRFLSKGKPVTCYDHGWLFKSVVTDRHKLFGDSYYYDTIRDIVKECPDINAAKQSAKQLLDENISKRPQPRQDLIPDVPFIFVPGQVLFDASVVHYSKTGMRELLEQTVKFAAQHGLHVVYKPHPGLMHFKDHGKAELERFQEVLLGKFNNFHIVNTSIFDLMRKARFTACVNSGSIIDNIVSQTPVYCCGRSFFSHSGTIVFDENVGRGLLTMLNRDYDWDEMKLQQLRMLWWLQENLMQYNLPVEENIRRLEKHSGIALI